MGVQKTIWVWFGWGTLIVEANFCTIFSGTPQLVVWIAGWDWHLNPGFKLRNHAQATPPNHQIRQGSCIPCGCLDDHLQQLARLRRRDLVGPRGPGARGSGPRRGGGGIGFWAEISREENICNYSRAPEKETWTTVDYPTFFSQAERRDAPGTESFDYDHPTS